MRGGSSLDSFPGKGTLHTLEIENFKSYKGKHTIGPFTRFTAIIGPNGSGKSNLMDAISFVLGEKPSSLRVRKYADLIHGAPINKPVAKKCRVTMNYKYSDGKVKAFTRGVNNGTSEHLLDGQTVTSAAYSQEMESINIFIKARNFLVYQGAIENIAMKTPKERTQLFEELSRSHEFQAEYERLKVEMTKAEDDTQHNMNKRRGIAQEKREAKMEKDEAEKYQTMKNELAAKSTMLFLHQLFHCERTIDESKEEINAQKKTIASLEATRSKEEAKIAAVHQEHRKALREVQKMTRKLDQKETDLAEKQQNMLTLKVSVAHEHKKLEIAKKMLAAAESKAENNSTQLADLKKSKKELEKKKAAYEAEIQDMMQRGELNLSDEQVREYGQLKDQAQRESAMVQRELLMAEQVFEGDKSSLNHELRRQKEHQERVKAKEGDVRRIETQIATLAQRIKETEEETKILKADLKKIENDVVIDKSAAAEYNKELVAVVRQLSEASGDSAEGERNQRRTEALEGLKKNFPESVYGRLVDLCQPSHKRFNIATTKILQKHMNSIVCDTEETAAKAIVYLKDHRYPPETFLPNDALVVNPLNEKLREIKKPAGVKLVFDVINPQHQAARKALQFVCGNALVCESQEDAKQLAYGGGELKDRFKAVSMDGTLFQQSGVMSGGSADLRQKSKKWDEKVVKQLREKRNQLNEKIADLQKHRRRELEVESVRSKINGNEQRLAMMKRDLKNMREMQLERLQNELEGMTAEMNMLPPRISNCQEKLERSESTLKSLQTKSNEVADRIFADFCTRVGIASIRDYENREMRIKQEMEDKLRSFDDDIQKLAYEIDFVTEQDGNRKVEVEKEKVSQIDRQYKDMKKKEKTAAAALKEHTESMEQDKEVLEEKKALSHKLETEWNEVKKIAQVAMKDFTKAEKELLRLESLLTKKQYERHSLLHSVKLGQIALPLKSGSMADVEYEEDDGDDTASQSSQSATDGPSVSEEQIQREQHIKINYDSLPREYKDVDDDDGVRQMSNRLNVEIDELQKNVSKMNAPNLKANQRMAEVKEREAESTEELENARKKAKRIRQQFEKVKTDRYRRFQDFFDPVANTIDDIYKQLSRNTSAQAFLGADNMEEPYLDGIQYNCVAPGKRFRPMDNLSGGEKTIAALALLFAVHGRNPAPFFVLDEIDAALDNTNIGKVASYICESAREHMQIIVISLKEEFYNKADSLIGIFPYPAACTTSGVLTFDLTRFKQIGLNEMTENPPTPSIAT
ncbi:Structural maintenance of chromosomes protein 1 [Caenorhabditis elegans]|uniref:Structural maintenance of chromosomes protein 1 n=2 Tax=Caenorhabditis elegans TaxID=6239 RepID=SMC1_CAEEL|nr:Structural maintenance of chromosomes protein 1 [Caenorhabditis elegans]O01789.4 RecName: Full=Structural maintenance of chromosomes protein 1; AltName: Full=High incidence of males protein 1 [Caenorhabditis elegans]CCD69832.1 Structural maintenance of chromosomes protein 1 [Caenorhabditis elegans]|eukprot:NP_001040658.2 Structural maintenance of chromosomes protein 1 [Caenorhabditis elegans]